MLDIGCPTCHGSMFCTGNGARAVSVKGGGSCTKYCISPIFACLLCFFFRHRGEDYVLQIDSHMRFRQNWDSYLIQHLHQCPITANRKAMLTTYPVGYQLPNNIPNETRGTLLVPWKFDPKDGFLRQRAHFFTANNITGKTSSPVLCHLYAAPLV